jgi:hypothetical protein
MILRGDEQLSGAQPSTCLEFNGSIALDRRGTEDWRCVFGGAHFPGWRTQAVHGCSAFLSAVVGNTDQSEVVSGLARLWNF